MTQRRGINVEDLASELPRVIEYSGEFGLEIVCFVPFANWLKSVGLMRNRKLRTYAGMRSLYYFLADDEYEEKIAARRFTHGHERPFWLPNRSEHTATKSPYETYPDYRTRYAVPALNLGKPLLIVHNKYHREWSRPPINFFDCETLDAIFESLKKRFSVVYIRHGRENVQMRGFSSDHGNRIAEVGVPPLNDNEVLKRHPEIHTFEELYEIYGNGDLNRFKNRLYANAYYFVVTQGGGSHQCAMFRGSLQLVLHREGQETRHAYGAGYYRYMANPAPLLLVTDSREKLIAALDLFKTSKVFGERVAVDPVLLQSFEGLLPETQGTKR